VTGLGTFSNVRTFDLKMWVLQCPYRKPVLPRLSAARMIRRGREFTAASNVTPDEKRSGLFKIRWYISLMVATGERDPKKLAGPRFV
jgi:hypothetical protein